MTTEYVVNFDVIFIAEDEVDAKAVRESLTESLRTLPDVADVLPGAVEVL